MLSICAKRSILDVWQGSEYTLDDTSRLDRLRKCVLLWKSSAFIVLSTIPSQSKAKTITHTVF